MLSEETISEEQSDEISYMKNFFFHGSILELIEDLDPLIKFYIFQPLVQQNVKIIASLEHKIILC